MGGSSGCLISDMECWIVAVGVPFLVLGLGKGENFSCISGCYYSA